MARASPIQGNFNSGEFSPLLQGRVDAERYKSGLSLCSNAIPTLQGPVTRRAGSRFVAPTKNAGDKVIMIPFKYSNTQAYMLEFGDGYIRFFSNRQQVVTAPNTPLEVATLIPLALLPQLKFVQSLDVLYLVHPALPPMKLLRHSALDWTIQFIDFKDGPYLNSGLPPQVTQLTSIAYQSGVQISATGDPTEVQFDSLTFQNGAFTAILVANIVNNGSGECRITLSDTSTFSDRSQVYVNGAAGTTGANGTWIAKQINANQYDLVGSVFNAPYTANSAEIRPAPFVPSDANNRLIRGKLSGKPWGYGHIKTYINGSSVIIKIYNSFGPPYGAGRADFALGAYSASTGFPSCATFHDDRLYLGGALGSLQRVDASNTSDYENFAPTQLDAAGTQVSSNALSFSINSNDANPIVWMTSDQYGMPIGTKGGPFVMRASSLNEAITPTNVSVKRVDSVGACDLMPVYAGKSTIYLSISTRKLFELTYYYNIDGFRRVDLAEIAENLPGEGIASNVVFQSAPQPIIWCARDDGIFLGMTFDRNLDVLRTGWSRHQLGGVSDNAGTPAVIEYFGVIPSPDGTVDDLWFIVKRYINGATVRYVEYMDKIFESFDNLEDFLGSDSGATFDNPKTVSGITSATVAVVHAVAHGLASGNHVKFKNVNGLKSNTFADVINNIEFLVTVLDADHFSIPLDSSVLTAYISGGFVRKQVTTISGFTWLEGETVAILGDGVYLGTAVVAGGSITLPVRAGTVQIGLPFEVKIQQLRLDAGSSDGTAIGKVSTINETAIMVDRSFDFEIGTDFTRMDPVVVANNDDNYHQADPLFTGILGRIQVESNFDYQSQLAFRIKTPTPFTMTAIMPQKTTNGNG